MASQFSFFHRAPSQRSPLPFFTAPIKAGYPSHADDHIEASLDLNEHLIQHPAATFFVRVDGDSMNGAKIQKGDILIVDRSLQAKTGQIVIAVVDGEFTVKRIRMGEGKIELEAENPHYRTIEIAPGADFQVWGVVTYIIHKT